MSEATYHVTCVSASKPNEEHKKRLVLQDKTVYKEAMLSLFGLPMESDVIIQMYDNEFCDWIDVDHDALLPDGGKLKIIVCEGMQLIHS